MLEFICAKDEPLGEVIHYFWRREYQSRGTQHFHVLIWVKNAPVKEMQQMKKFAEFVSQYITCVLPDKEAFPTLHRRVTEYQTHHHNSYCMRSKKTQ